MTPEFPQENLQAAANGLRAIAHPLRLAILCHLTEGPKNVGELLALTHVSQPNLSQHLAKLRMLGVLNSERRSQHIFYCLADNGFVRIVEALKTVYCKTPESEAGKS